MPNEGHRGGAVRRQRPHQPAHDEPPRREPEPPSGEGAARNPERGEHATPARRAEGDRGEDEGAPDTGLEAGPHDQAEVELRRAVPHYVVGCCTSQSTSGVHPYFTTGMLCLGS